MSEYKHVWGVMEWLVEEQVGGWSALRFAVDEQWMSHEVNVSCAFMERLLSHT